MRGLRMTREKRLYEYGHSCGKTKIIYFHMLGQLADLYDYADRNRQLHGRSTLKGFRDRAVGR